jgi:predicted dehydrogenase
MNDVTRRHFIKAAGTAAGLAVATGYSPRTYAANERIQVGMIGTGGQGGKHIEHGIPGAPRLKLAALCDVYRPHRDEALKLVDTNYPEDEAAEVVEYKGDYREMLDNESLDAVVISTPLDRHYAMVMECLDRGLYVFCEKTMAYTIEQCRKIVTRCHETGKFCQVGHQRRYNPIYNKALWLARHRPVIGRINHVSAQWHRNEDWRRFVDPHYQLDATEAQFIPDLEEHVNWRLYFKYSCGLMTELGTHQTDIANWFIGAPPSAVIAYGGNDYWMDNRDVEDNVTVMYTYDVKRTCPSFFPVPVRTDDQDKRRASRPYKVRFSYSSITANAKKGAVETIHGDVGTFELSEAMGGRVFAEWGPIADKRKLAEVMTADEQARRVVTQETQPPAEAFAIGLPILIYPSEESTEVVTVDQKAIETYQFQAFADDVVNNAMPKANQYVGLLTAITGLAAVQSLREGKQIDIDPAWYNFDFDVPDAYRYDYVPGNSFDPDPDADTYPYV